MSKTRFPLCCYSNGELVVEGETISYINGIESFVVVDSDIRFNNLYNLICEELEVDISKYKLEIKLKFPTFRGYKVINLNSDKVLDVMWASVYQTNAASMDLYINFIPTEPTLEVNPCSFTSLLNQVSGADDNPWPITSEDNDIGDETSEDNDIVLNDFDEDEDLVSSSAPICEFTKLYNVDPLSSFDGKKLVAYEKDGEFCVNQRFKDKKTLAKTVKLYHIEKGQSCYVKESNPQTVTYACSREPNACTWYLRASRQDVSDAFTIVTYKGPHKTSCVGDKIPLDHPNLSSAIVSDFIKDLVAADWGMSPRLIQAIIKKEYKYSISYIKAWKAKEKAISEIFGNWEDSYALLPRYLQALKEANPGTCVHFVNKDIGSSEIEKFGMVFWAFGASIRGFKHCRPVITVDATHLYGKYRGVLMIAMGVDAEGQIYPLAFAIAKKESVKSWSWFFCCLRHYVTKPNGLCVISDRHIGLIQAMKKVGSGWEEPYAFHRYCIRHHASNIKNMFESNKIKDLFTEMAEERQIIKWETRMKQMGELRESVRAFLEKIPKENWSIAHDGGYRYGIKTSNLVECFNGVLKKVRFLPITALATAIFYRVNSYFVDRRDKIKAKMLKGALFSDRVMNKIERNIQKATYHQVHRYNRDEGIYGVITGRKNTPHTVNLSSRTCTCNKWQIYHYPCSHLMAVCVNENLEYGQFIDHFYSMQQYLASYRPSFHPVSAEPYWRPWTGKKLIPNPKLKREKGRRKSKRFQNEMDNPTKEKRKVKCSLCNGEGHNKRSCTSRASGSNS